MGQIYALNHQLPLNSQGAAMGRFNVLVIRTANRCGRDVRSSAWGCWRRSTRTSRWQSETMQRVVDRHLESRRLNTLLLGLFARHWP